MGPHPEQQCPPYESDVEYPDSHCSSALSAACQPDRRLVATPASMENASFCAQHAQLLSIVSDAVKRSIRPMIISVRTPKILLTTSDFMCTASAVMPVPSHQLAAARGISATFAPSVARIHCVTDSDHRSLRSGKSLRMPHHIQLGNATMLRCDAGSGVQGRQCISSRRNYLFISRCVHWLNS